MNNIFNIDAKILKEAERALDKCKQQFAKIDDITEYNQHRVLKAFMDNGISERHFMSSTGYGYGDIGREALDAVCANIFQAEDALVRHNFVCGTHALTVALFGMLRPGDTMLSVTGEPYDTLKGVIGLNGNNSGSLKEFGINYKQINLMNNGNLDFNSISELMNEKIKMIYIQRSRGYTLRPSLFVEDISKVAEIVKKKCPDCIVMLDNCYGEFVEKREPLSNGVDIMAGSLIKNPGGGIASTGGYIAGKKHLVEQCSYRLTTPGLGKEVGATLGQNRELFMGIFNAPHITGEALKNAIFTAALFENLGYDAIPKYNEPRADIVQAIKLGNDESLIAFCQGIQKGAPIDSFVIPEPWDMPGYENKVIMASGSFTLGSSIELSADAPLRDPYAVWMQGGLNFHSAKIGVMLAVQLMLDKGILHIC